MFGRFLMLSEKTVQHLATLVYRPDAEWFVNILPFGSVYWADEMPEVKQLVLFGIKDQLAILQMFSIRLKLWDGEALTTEERETWDAIRQQVPEWALLRRTEPSEEQRLARSEAERKVALEFESLDD
jgi:hypothetical protein